MGVLGEDLPVRCPGCSEEVEPGMAFCMLCGYALDDEDLPAASSPQPGGRTLSREQAQLPAAGDGQTCPACGKFDPLSNRFCVHCGHAAESVPLVYAEPVGSSEARLRSNTAAEIISAQAGPPGLTMVLALGAAVGGAVLGLLVAFLLLKSPVEQLIIRGQWPADGLVIYASRGGAQVTIEDAARRTFTVGQLGPRGELVVPDLAPGAYKVTISAPGYRSHVEDVEVLRDKVTVIGYPKRLELSHSG